VHATDADLADANLLEAVRLHARWQDPVEAVEHDGLLLIAGSTAFPGGYRNCAVRTDSALDAGSVLQRAQAFFSVRARGFAVIVRSARDADLERLLQEHSLSCVGASPCMLLDKPVREARPPAGVWLESFAGERQVRDAVNINMEAYPLLRLPAEEVAAYFAKPQCLLEDNVSGFVLYRNGRPCSTAITLHSGRASGLYWVGTAADARRQGLAEICVRRATNAGFEHGAQVVTLQASPFGAALYERLGYRSYDTVKFYHHRRVASAAQAASA
jgi:ribosomal protein S18 acetylase RimI-like enzyme